MEIDMAPFIVDKFYDSETNPFHVERQDQFKYKLSALIVYSEATATREGYVTYVRQGTTDQWFRYSK